MRPEPPDASVRARILPFEPPVPRRRGRPRSAHPPGQDRGTPELIMKRARGATAEMLDTCLERGLISPQQHGCGLHLRWLYTLRHGVPSLRALDLSCGGGGLPGNEDAGWRRDRERDYREAMQALALSGHVSLLMNICVYNEQPPFLAPLRSRAQAARAGEALAGFTHGLDILVRLWRRGGRA